MTKNLRKSGIDVLGEILPWGTHFCQFYETKKDLLELLIPYFKAGLENNEFCLWITSDPLSAEDALDALRIAIPDFDQYVKNKSIEILPHMDWYLKTGKFNGEIIIAAWIQKLNDVLARGYDGMRVNSNDTWLRTDDWDNFMEYENELNSIVAGKHIILLCSYPLSYSAAGPLLDVAHAHECVISKRKGHWEILEKPEFKKIKSKLKKQSDKPEQPVEKRTAEMAALISELRKEITERKKTEALLEKEKKMSNEIIDSIPGLFALFDVNLRFIRWNRNFELVSGYTPDEILKLHGIESFFDNECDKKRTFCILAEILEKGSGSAEVSPLMKDGEPIHLFFNGRSFKLGDKKYLITTGVDITDLKTTEAKFRTVVEQSLMGFYIIKDGKYSYVNPRFAEIFGYRQEELIDSYPVEILFHSDDRIMVKEYVRARVAGELNSIWYEAKGLKKNGEVINIEIFCSGTLRGKSTAIMGTLLDVTESKQAEEKMKQSYQQIRSLTEHLQNIREEERTNIAREIHDELGQQLTVIKMDVAWLNKKLSNIDVTLKGKIEGLLELLDNMVQSVRRISSELRPSMLDDLGLPAAIEWQLNEFEKRTGVKTSFIEHDEELTLPRNISTNFYRVFQESLTNIARHADARQVTVELGRKDNQLLLKITDNGKGFNIQKLDEKRTWGIIGMNERAAMIGGSIEIDSEPGKGTRITLTTPIELPDLTDA
jgi:PAS domain S-box-containing protein